MSAPVFTANSDYIIIDRSPLLLEAGDAVTLGPADRVWPGWVSLTTCDGRSTYVPEDSVAIGEDGSGTMRIPFDATDLSVRKGEKVISLRETCGWHWGRAANGSEGWVPGYVLQAEASA